MGVSGAGERLLIVDREKTVVEIRWRWIGMSLNLSPDRSRLAEGSCLCPSYVNFAVNSWRRDITCVLDLQLNSERSLPAVGARSAVSLVFAWMTLLAQHLLSCIAVRHPVATLIRCKISGSVTVRVELESPRPITYVERTQDSE